MINLVKKVFVTENTIFVIFESETREEEHVTKVALTKKQYYCSCEDFLFRNNLEMMYEGRVYKCKHISFVEHMLININLLNKLVELGKMTINDYYKLFKNYKKILSIKQ